MRVFTVRGGDTRNLLPTLGVEVVHHQYSGKGRVYTEQETLELVGEFRKASPDIFYFLKDEQLTPSILQALAKASPKTKFVMVYGDQRGGVPPLIYHRRNFLSALLINNEDPAQIKMYQDIGIPNVFTFHHAIPVDEFQNFEYKIEHDVFFGGSNFNHRKFPLSAFRYDFITAVRKKFDLVVYGAGWPFPTKQRVPRNIYAKELRKANINLGANHYDVIRYYDRRLFECMASGRLHITYYVPGMEQDFENHKHLVWFTKISEGINFIKHYLKYPEKIPDYR